MAFKKNCILCNKSVFSAKMLHLADGNDVCMNCIRNVPDKYRNFAKKNWNIQFMNNFLYYIESENKIYQETFSETHHFGNVSLDAAHGLFYIKSNHFSKPENEIIYNLKYIKDCSFSFVPTGAKNVMGKVLVTGNAIMRYTSSAIGFAEEVVIDYNMKTTGALQGLNGNEVSIQQPKKLEEFSGPFFQAIYRCSVPVGNTDRNDTYSRNAKHNSESNSRSRREEREQRSNNASEEKNLELLKAMSLFMIDSLDGVTESDLKKIRNRLLKTYHPDNGVADEDGIYTQRINDAFALLKQNL